MPDVRCERKGQALWLTIDREERRNALNEAVFDGLRAGIAQAEASPEVRAVVITGAGEKAFCAGGDLKPNAEGDPFTVDPAERDNPAVKLFRAIIDLPRAGDRAGQRPCAGRRFWFGLRLRLCRGRRSRPARRARSAHRHFSDDDPALYVAHDPAAEVARTLCHRRADLGRRKPWRMAWSITWCRAPRSTRRSLHWLRQSQLLRRARSAWAAGRWR